MSNKCSIDGCDRPRVARGWCDKHYKRWHHHGHPGRIRKRGEKRVDTRGYVIVVAPNHPLANCKGEVYEHRMVLWDSDKPRFCWSCGEPVGDDWQGHHLSGIKTDNRLESLAFSCHACNKAEARVRAGIAIREKIGRFYTYKGRRLTITDWARLSGLSAATITRRLAKGWDMERVLSESLKRTRRKG